MALIAKMGNSAAGGDHPGKVSDRNAHTVIRDEFIAKKTLSHQVAKKQTQQMNAKLSAHSLKPQ